MLMQARDWKVEVTPNGSMPRCLWYGGIEPFVVTLTFQSRACIDLSVHRVDYLLCINTWHHLNHLNLNIFSIFISCQSIFFKKDVFQLIENSYLIATFLTTIKVHAIQRYAEIILTFPIMNISWKPMNIISQTYVEWIEET